MLLPMFSTYKKINNCNHKDVNEFLKFNFFIQHLEILNTTIVKNSSFKVMAFTPLLTVYSGHINFGLKRTKIIARLCLVFCRWSCLPSSLAQS